MEMNERVRQGDNEGGAAEPFCLCCGQAVLRGWEVWEMAGVTSQLPRLLSTPRLHHLAETQRPGNINGVQTKKPSSSEPGYFRLCCCFRDPYLYPVPAGILDVASTVINNQS